MNTPQASLVGKVLNDRFRVIETIGQGAMATVYRAEPVAGGASVAVKVMQTHMLQRDGQRERFEREARALFALQHPRILHVEDYGVIDKVPFIVTELLDGKTLDAYLQAKLPPPDRGIVIACQVLEGLAYAHAQGVIHRDLKTENIFIHEQANGVVEAKLLDFGLVKFLDDRRWGFGNQLTATGDIFGSPAYMSPEQCLGAPLDPRSDVYSMGIVLFEILTGRWPFMEPNQARMLHAHVSLEPPRISEVRADIAFPPGLDSVFRKSLAKQKEHRYADANAMRESLERILAGTPSTNPGKPSAPEAKAEREPVSGTAAATELLGRARLKNLGPRGRLALAGSIGAGAGVVLGLIYLLMTR